MTCIFPHTWLLLGVCTMNTKTLPLLCKLVAVSANWLTLDLVHLTSRRLEVVTQVWWCDTRVTPEQVWWCHTRVTPELGRWRREDLQTFQTSPGLHTETLSQKGVVWENGRMSGRGGNSVGSSSCCSASGPKFLSGKRELTPASVVCPPTLWTTREHVHTRTQQINKQVEFQEKETQHFLYSMMVLLGFDTVSFVMSAECTLASGSWGLSWVFPSSRMRWKAQRESKIPRKLYSNKAKLKPRSKSTHQESREQRAHRWQSFPGLAIIWGFFCGVQGKRCLITRSEI